MLRRKDSFFGLHFDYHANADTPDIGKDFDEKVLERIVTEVKPDFIQCDTKGHPGYTSYKTEVGTCAPHLVRDLLALWRKVTAEHDVALYSHYSGIWDKKATADHPEWACVNEDGTITDRVSPTSEYADKLLIPQLIELATEYKMNGAWVDGECWAVVPDYSERTKRLYFEKTGKRVEDIKTREDRQAFYEFNRDNFLAYVKHYITEVKKVAPDFDVTSNWCNTAWVPDKIDYTDYISGDLSPTNSVDSARFDGRVMQSFGRNWDIMSWGISFPIHYAKSAVQLEQEAAVIMALGGGFQVYNMQSPNRVVMDEWAIPVWAEVSAFCRERKEFCHGGKVLPDVGIVLSKKAYYNSFDWLFSRDCEYNLELYGMLLAFADKGKNVSVINAEGLGVDDFMPYKTVVLTDADVTEDELKTALLNYAERGGELLLCGCKTAKLFEKELGYKVERVKDRGAVAMITGERYAVEVRKPYAVIADEFADAVYMHECRVDGDIACTNPPPSVTVCEEKIPAFFTLKKGSGTVSVMPITVGRLYLDDRTFELSYFMNDCLAKCKKVPLYVDKQGLVEFVATEKNGKTYLHFINLAGEHRSPVMKSFDVIPPVYEVGVNYPSAVAPKKVVLRPQGTELPFDFKDGAVSFKIDKLNIYEICELVF